MEMSRTKFYRVWNSMKQRCINKNDAAYKWYGKRGITVSDKWLIFSEFFKDMYPSYQQGLWLDRIDNNEGYSKENCRWATKLEQANNKRDNKRIFFNNMKKTLPEWARFLGIKRSTLAQRYYVYKWSLEKCFKV